jgi:hypothetical protein
MQISRHELIEFLDGEIEALKLAMKGHVQPKKHLDEADDGYQFVEDSLDRWGDRQYPKDDSPSLHVRLEREADRLLSQ